MSEIESEFLKTDEKDGNLVDAPVKKTSVKPTELLPKTDAASTWADANPVSDPGLDENLLDAGFHVGVNTVGQSLRNANLQIRSEPANPVTNVSPWLNTTISPDLERRPLEICSDDVAAAFNVVGLGGGSEEFASLAQNVPYKKKERNFQEDTKLPILIINNNSNKQYNVQLDT